MLLVPEWVGCGWGVVGGRIVGALVVESDGGLFAVRTGNAAAAGVSFPVAG